MCIVCFVSTLRTVPISAQHRRSVPSNVRTAGSSDREVRGHRLSYLPKRVGILILARKLLVPVVQYSTQQTYIAVPKKGADVHEGKSDKMKRTREMTMQRMPSNDFWRSIGMSVCLTVQSRTMVGSVHLQ